MRTDMSIWILFSQPSRRAVSKTASTDHCRTNGRFSKKSVLVRENPKTPFEDSYSYGKLS